MVILYHVAIIIVQKPAMPWRTSYEKVNHVKIVIFLVNRNESLHVRIVALGDAILETVLHARYSLSGHVTVVQWFMCLSVYITIACPQRVKRLSVHVVGHVTESCQIVRIYAQRHVILVNAQMLRNAVKRSQFDANAKH